MGRPCRSGSRCIRTARSLRRRRARHGPRGTSTVRHSPPGDGPHDRTGGSTPLPAECRGTHRHRPACGTRSALDLGRAIDRVGDVGRSAALLAFAVLEHVNHYRKQLMYDTGRDLRALWRRKEQRQAVLAEDLQRVRTSGKKRNAATPERKLSDWLNAMLPAVALPCTDPLERSGVKLSHSPSGATVATCSLAICAVSRPPTLRPSPGQQPDNVGSRAAAEATARVTSPRMRAWAGARERV